jgi:hypothetical protein
MGDEKKVDHGALVVGGLYASSLYGGWRSRALQNISLII